MCSWLTRTSCRPAAEHWTEPPFEGVVKDGYVWGRGAIDVKNLLAAFCVVMRRLAEEGRDFAGEVVFVAEADEEDGAVGGARWLVSQRPDLVRCDYLLNEGGGEFLDMPGGERLYELHVGEKGTAQFRVVVSGESGHASVPLRRGNAVVGAADVVRALHDYEPRLSLDTVPGEYVELLVADPALRARLLDESSARAALAELGERDRARRRPARPALRRHVLADDRPLERRGRERLSPERRRDRGLPHAGGLDAGQGGRRGRRPLWPGSTRAGRSSGSARSTATPRRPTRRCAAPSRR